MYENHKRLEAASAWLKEQKKRFADWKAYLRTPEGKNLIPAIATGAVVTVALIAGLQILTTATKPDASQSKPPITFVCDSRGVYVMAVDVGPDIASPLDDTTVVADDMVDLGLTQKGLRALQPLGATIYSRKAGQPGFGAFNQGPAVLRTNQPACAASMVSSAP